MTKDTLPSPVSVPEGDAREIADERQTLLDKDDRTSPAEYPDMALITFDEFRAALLSAESRGESRMRERAALSCDTGPVGKAFVSRIRSLPLSSPEEG